MRAWSATRGLTVRAVAGTSTVFLGFDLVDADAARCLGFGIHRTDHTEEEAYWLRGMKSFARLVPRPAPGTDYSLREHPLQGFHWGDYSAKPDHDYTYRVVAWQGTPERLVPLVETRVSVRTESEDDGVHGVWFNRGVAGSQAFARRFPWPAPPGSAEEGHPAFAWLSRGLGEAFLAFVARADGPRWGLRGAFYEFTWPTGLAAIAAAARTGADVALVVHGRDRDAATATVDRDTTAASNRAAVTVAGLDAQVTWRTADVKNALQHNKFLVLTRDGRPVAVWTGSTNLTLGAIYGHLNVGHVVHDRKVARRFLDYWRVLADPASTTDVLRTWTEAGTPVDLAAPPPSGLTTVLSPRARSSTLLGWYADAFDAAVSSAHITGAFGLNKVFRERLAVDRDVVRTVLLDQPPKATAPIPQTDPDVRTSWGAVLEGPLLEGWAAEHLTGFNRHVKFVHTKIILIDPLTSTPTVVTGSANYSDASTTTNEENSVVIRGGDVATRRVADIYFTEYQRIFMHFVFRDWAATDPDADGGRLRLAEDASWTVRYYEPGGWRERQRHTFAGA